MARQQLVKRTHILAYNPDIAHARRCLVYEDGVFVHAFSISLVKVLKSNPRRA